VEAAVEDGAEQCRGAVDRQQIERLSIEIEDEGVGVIEPRRPERGVENR